MIEISEDFVAFPSSLSLRLYQSEIDHSSHIVSVSSINDRTFHQSAIFIIEQTRGWFSFLFKNIIDCFLMLVEFVNGIDHLELVCFIYRLFEFSHGYFVQVSDLGFLPSFSYDFQTGSCISSGCN
jgi:hypothetical protein